MATHDDRCLKCSGKAYIPAYARWNGGQCYRCEGTGREPPKGDSRGRPVGRGRGGKAPHPSAAEAKAIADRELQVAAASFEDAEQFEAMLADIDDPRHRKQEVDRVAAFYFSVGISLGRSIVDFARFQRALPRARSRVPVNDRYFASFEQGLEYGIKEQSERYEGIRWEGR